MQSLVLIGLLGLLLVATEGLKCRQGQATTSNRSAVPVAECESLARSCVNITTIWFNTTYFGCSNTDCTTETSDCIQERSSGGSEQYRCCCREDGCNSDNVRVLSAALVVLVVGFFCFH